jgi:acyl-CoA synthetase (AMP-forming)/AMP-acid ligase II
VLIELLRDAAREAPERPAIRSAERTVTYAECAELGERLARGLATRGVERFGVAVDEPADTIALLAAASAIGAEPCVYRRGVDDAGLQDYASRFAHPVIVADEPREAGGAEVIEMRDLLDGEAELPPPPDHSPILILTTGTTGEQKAARHDWTRLVAGVRRPEGSSDARWLLAYNLAQFAGIQILVHVLVTRSTLVVPPTNQPRAALDTIRELGVTHISATPTFWRLLAGGLDEAGAAGLDLEQVTLGGEAPSQPLIARLQELFPKARISQIYGGTEFGTVVSVRDGQAGLPASVLERGEDADAQFRVVDGELHVRSVGMLGYHGGGDDRGDWRSTGDLVEVRDERIHFVGRTTDVINVGGAKVHPLPVEEVVGSVDGVELAWAYGRSNPVTGSIVAVEVTLAPGFDPATVESDIRAACEALPGAARPRRIKFVDEVELRGHKLVRQASAD